MLAPDSEGSAHGWLAPHTCGMIMGAYGGGGSSLRRTGSRGGNRDWGPGTTLKSVRSLIYFLQGDLSSQTLHKPPDSVRPAGDQYSKNKPFIFKP